VLVTILIHEKPKNTKDALEILLKSGETIKKTRPTAVNLFWAIDRILKCAEMFTNEVMDNFNTAIEQELLPFIKRR
jgi:methylthioribose-1-phosphate isomerase